jgi:hypothetical protein
MVYVDDGIFLGNDNDLLTEAIREIQSLGLNIEDQGHPADYVGVNIWKLKDGSYEFTQRALIDSIIQDVGLDNAKGVKPVPAKVSLHLHAAKDQKPYVEQPYYTQAPKVRECYVFEYFRHLFRYLHLRYIYRD